MMGKRVLAAACRGLWYQQARREKGSVPCLIKPEKEWHRPQIFCDKCLPGPQKKPCFDLSKVLVERGGECHVKLIRSFLFTHFWPRDPSIVSLYMCLNSPYLKTMTEFYANASERFLAFEIEPRTGERRLIGLCIGAKILAWQIQEYEEWADATDSRPEKFHMYFMAHCNKNANLAYIFSLPYVFDISVIATIPEVTGHGVASLLLNKVLDSAKQARYPCTQILATNYYLQKILKRTPNLVQSWSMRYEDFVDDSGQQIFCPRRPHLSVVMYERKFTCALGSE